MPAAKSQKEGSHRSEQNLDRQVLNEGALELRHQEHPGQQTVKTHNGRGGHQGCDTHGKTHMEAASSSMRDQASVYPNWITLKKEVPFA